jgi:Carboxypeptidase regulatory-like domain
MKLRVCLLSLAVLFVTTFAAAQGGATSSISGVVVDSNGGVIPGATISVKNLATGTTFDTVTNTSGTFSVPALDAGTYSVTVTLEGFKTVVIDDVRLVPGTPASVRATLEVGNLAETITVRGGSDLVNTQTATIAATLSVDQINKMPMPTRNAINAVTFLPGVNTAGINRDSNFNGLPDSFVAITLDGVNNNDNFNKSTEGLFAMVTPRQDAVEAVTVTTAAGGADVGGHGAVQLSFVTRSGTNRFTGSAYEYYRAPELNSNYWFNTRSGLPRNDAQLNQYGVRQGGPIVIPGLYDGRNKAFFFVNYEELQLPNNFTRTRNVLNQTAQAGLFRYVVGSGVREVNLLDLAARTGQTTTLDPLTQRVLGYMNAGMRTTGALNPQPGDPNLMDYVWQSPGKQREWQPVVRLDYNLTTNHRLSGTYNWVKVVRDPDQLNNGDIRFPGGPNYSKYLSTRPLASVTLRSTLSSTLVNELRGGSTKGGTGYFGLPSSNGPQTFTDTDSFALNLTNSNNNNNGLNLTDWHVENGPTWRSAYSYNIDDTLSWQKGTHSLSFGGAMFFGRTWENAQQIVPGITLGVNTDFDPAASMFNGTNLPGASTAQLTDARELYALLTGRVSAVTGQAALDANTNQYVAFGERRRAGEMNEFSLFAQDSWRLTPALTVNGGLRWDLQLPFTPVNDIMSTVTYDSVCGISGVGADGRCQFFQPGVTPGPVPEFIQFTKGTRGYQTDWNNVAPNVSAAWRPGVESGFLRPILGDPDQATIRGGYSVAYDRQGMGRFTGQFGVNPGTTLSLTRNGDLGNLVTAGQTWPVLLSQRDRLYNAPFPTTPTYPIAVRPGRGDAIETFDPLITVAFARSWTIGFQRALTSDMAMEIRYVGTRGVNQWTEVNYNTIRGENLLANGFLDEFRRAMTNLQANNAAGGNRTGSFAYFGPGTGTSALPIYLAYLTGRSATQAGDPAAYTGGSQTWTSTTLASRLVQTNPDPTQSATDLDGNETRRQNAITAGLPRNFFVPNPDVGNLNVFESAAYSDYHALQVEVRRRLSHGLQVNGSYQYALEGGSSFLGQSYGRVMNPTANVRHAIKAQWDWTIPVGQGQRFGSSMNSVLNAIVGGWQFDGVGRIQARTLDFGNVRLVGMSVDELTKEYRFRIEPDPTTGLNNVWMLPEDIRLNTRRAFSTSTTSTTGYSELGVPEGRYLAPANSPDCIQLKAGDCAPRTLLVRAPFFTRFDIGVTKRFPIHGSLNVELRADVLNVFDNVNFTPVATPGTAATTFQVTAAYTDLNNQFDPGGRLGQLVLRLNW